MTQYISKSALVTEIERRRQELRPTNTHKMQVGEKVDRDVLMWLNALTWVKTLLENIDTLEVKEVQEEPVSKDLKEASDNYVGHAPEIDEDLSCFTNRNAFIAGAQWKKGNLWKNAQGDDLPEIDREVIVLYQPYQLEGSGECAVGFAHRPPERWYGRNLDGEEHVFEPKTYDKGEWNIPNVVWWLDLDLPIKGE